MKEDHPVPASVVKIMIGYFSHNILSKEERDKLDEWICASDENMKVFEEGVEMVESRKTDISTINFCN